MNNFKILGDEDLFAINAGSPEDYNFGYEVGKDLRNAGETIARVAVKIFDKITNLQTCY